ncbi:MULTISPECIES: IclR family transcriptional regulator [unclassified Achromobacter]|uniref:IclR family transcriptional regulator n=1 Tax=unclassified Achromobacter TaxID=2626865 RepID=UPI000B51882B|nr:MULTISPECIES: IclR family transcriptional regulator [unclassified Achromobacter]OWT77233.1 IclR family transcriptional regulator [Achromobacter sp. HZ28]OWT78114.1 IclR family transcriptional regulator [Achromobacter sp. HZ34]
MATLNPKNQVNSVAKAFAVIKAFDATLPEMTISEIAARAGLDRGTAFRLIQTLVMLGYVHAVPDSKRYRLGLKCLELGYAALSSRQDLADHAEPLLRAAVPAVADAASLGTLDLGEVVYLKRVQAGLGRHNMQRGPGTRIGAYGSALGHAMLAFLPRAQQIAALESAPRIKLSEHTLTELDALLARLDEVRARGYALSDGENAYGLRTIAAPVLAEDGMPMAGVSLTIDAGRMAMADFVAQAADSLRQLARQLTDAARLSGGAIRNGKLPARPAA